MRNIELQLKLRLHFADKQHFAKHPMDGAGSNIQTEIVDREKSFGQLDVSLYSPKGSNSEEEIPPTELMGKKIVTDVALKPHKVFRRTSGLDILHGCSNQQESERTTFPIESNMEIAVCGI